MAPIRTVTMIRQNREQKARGILRSRVESTAQSQVHNDALAPAKLETAQENNIRDSEGGALVEIPSHPDTDKQITLGNPSALNPDKGRCRRLSLIYNLDKKVNQDEHWRQVGALIAAALNVTGFEDLLIINM